MALNQEQKEWYLNHIERLDPNNLIVKYDQETDRFQYNRDCQIRTDEDFSKTATPEEFVRALSIVLLSSNRFRYEPRFMYFEQYKTIGHPGSRAEVDLTVYDKDELAFAMWEFKSIFDYEENQDYYISHQLFDPAPNICVTKYLVYATIFPNTLEPEFTLQLINYEEYNTFDSWVEHDRQHYTEFPPDYEDENFRPLQQGTENDLKTNATHGEFKALFKSFHQAFFGEKQDTDLFKELLKLFLAKIFDEKTTIDNAIYRFQVLYSGRHEEDNLILFDRIRTLYRDAYRRYIEPNIPDDDIPDLTQNEFSPDKVKYVVKKIQRFSITKNTANQGDIVGSFFEEILRDGFKQDKGMYFTHANLVNFMIEALDIENLTKDTFRRANHISNRMPYIIDPACGSGSFLLVAMNKMTNAIKSNLRQLARDEDSREFIEHQMSDNRPNLWAKDFIYGSDPKFVMALTAKINMVLHGDGSAHIYKYDGVDSFSNYRDSRLNEKPRNQTTVADSNYNLPVCENFDVIITNPPFGITLEEKVKRNARTNFTLPETSSSEALFFERWFQLLKPNGRLAAVLPESFFNTSENIDARLLLYKFFKIKAIVSLPQNLFVDTPTLTSLLFAQKKTRDQINLWDQEWNRLDLEVKQVINRIKVLIRVREHDNLALLQQEILDLLAEVIDINGYIIKKGKAPIRINPVEPFNNLSDLKQHFRELMILSGFRQQLLLYIFKKITENPVLNHTFRTYCVDDVGYKLSKRNEKPRPNHLCYFESIESNTRVLNLHLTDDHTKVVTSPKKPITVLDYIKRDVTWE